ncbi:MAG: hypothetical protein AABX01_05615 [Candidatus Micrarchaeota archaeon]
MEQQRTERTIRRMQIEKRARELGFFSMLPPEVRQEYHNLRNWELGWAQGWKSVNATVRKSGIATINVDLLKRVEPKSPKTEAVNRIFQKQMRLRGILRNIVGTKGGSVERSLAIHKTKVDPKRGLRQLQKEGFMFNSLTEAIAHSDAFFGFIQARKVGMRSN